MNQQATVLDKPAQIQEDEPTNPSPLSSSGKMNVSSNRQSFIPLLLVLLVSTVVVTSCFVVERYWLGVGLAVAGVFIGIMWILDYATKR